MVDGEKGVLWVFFALHTYVLVASGHENTETFASTLVLWHIPTQAHAETHGLHKSTHTIQN